MASRFLPSALLLAASLTFSLAVAEGAARWVTSRPRNYLTITGGALHDPDSVVGWRPRPNQRYTMRTPEYASTIVNNADGFRWTSWDSTAACRVLVIGDSFVAGYAVDADSLFWQVAARASGCQVAGIGVIGYGSDQELVLLREYLLRLAPTHVVLAFYQNDVWCNHNVECEEQRKLRFTVRDGQLERTNDPPAVTPKPALDDFVARPAAAPAAAEDAAPGIALRIKRWLNAHSALYRVARAAILRPPYPVSEGVLSSLSPGAGQRDEFRVLHRPYDPDIADAWQVTEAIIAAMQRSSRDAGARFWLMQMPLRAQVWEREWPEAQAALGFGAGWQVNAVEDELRAICARQRIERCLFPALALRASKRATYFNGDAHFTAAGHAVVGAMLGDSLRTPLPSAPH